METARGRAQRRHVREKATIDHLVRDVDQPKTPDEKHTGAAPPPRPACRSRIRSARNGRPPSRGSHDFLAINAGP